MKMWKWLVPIGVLALGLFVGVGSASAEVIMPPDPQGRIVVANRGSGTISVIDVATNFITNVAMPAGPNTPDPMYFTYFAPTNTLFVGDRGNNRVVAFDAGTFAVQNFIPTGNGVFHQWGNTLQNQLWVVNDQDRTATVISMATQQVLTTVPVPTGPGLVGTIHDIILDANSPQAFITINNAAAATGIVRFSTNTFTQTGLIPDAGIVQVHVGMAQDNLYVANQGGNQIRVFNPNTLAEIASPVLVPGAHGADTNPSETIFYTTNLPAVAGQPGLFTIDVATNTLIGSPVNTPFNTPHNIAITPDGTRLYLTHSGAAATQVTFYDIGPDGVPVFAGTLNTGLNPFAIGVLPAGTVAVPEPSTLALLVLGGLPVARMMWLRRRRK